MNVINRRNYTVDIVRLIGAVSVVALHVPYGDAPNGVVLGIRWWGRWAVPFFFLLSGYFFQKNYAARGEGQFTKIFRTLVSIFVISNLIYAAAYLITHQGQKPEEILSFYTLSNGVNEHLWFIGSMIFGYLALLYLLPKASDKLLLAVAVIIYIALVLLDAYSLLLGTSFEQDVIRYFSSIPFLIGGFLLSKQQEWFDRIPVAVFIALLPIGFILQAGEIITLYKVSGYGPHNQIMVFGTLFFSLAVFGLALKLQVNQDTMVASWGRKYSLSIYLYHPLFNSFLLKVIDMSAVGGGAMMLLNPLISGVFCLVFFITLDKFFPSVNKVLNGV